MTILALALTFLLFANADVPQVNSLRPPAGTNVGTFSTGDEIPLFGNEASETDSQNPASAQDKSQNGSKGTTLQDSSKLNLIRYVSGEFARATKPLPAGKEGFIVHVGQPLDANMLERQVATHGAAVSTGDHVQITKLEFDDRQIVVDLNGGGRGKKRLRDRIHLEMGGIRLLGRPLRNRIIRARQDCSPGWEVPCILNSASRCQIYLLTT